MSRTRVCWRFWFPPLSRDLATWDWWWWSYDLVTCEHRCPIVSWANICPDLYPVSSRPSVKLHISFCLVGKVVPDRGKFIIIICFKVTTQSPWSYQLTLKRCVDLLHWSMLIYFLALRSLAYNWFLFLPRFQHFFLTDWLVHMFCGYSYIINYKLLNNMYEGMVSTLPQANRQSLAGQNLILFTPGAAGPWWL